MRGTRISKRMARSSDERLQFDLPVSEHNAPLNESLWAPKIDEIKNVRRSSRSKPAQTKTVLRKLVLLCLAAVMFT
jgi:hypothetical protein